MTDQLDELGHELPWDRPDDARRAAVRSSLLAAVADDRLPASRRRWTLGVAFAGGVAAAAIAALVVWPHTGAESKHLVEVEASPSAQLEHTTTRTASGDDELVRVHAGKIRVAVGDVRPGDRVHVATGDAEVEGAASYELVAAGDRLTEVTVHSGTAVVRVTGQKPVFLAAGQSWHAAIITTDLSPSTAPNTDNPSTAPTPVADNAPSIAPAPIADKPPALDPRVDNASTPGAVRASTATSATSDSLSAGTNGKPVRDAATTDTSAVRSSTTTTDKTSGARIPPTPRDVASDPSITTNAPPIVAPGTRAKTPTEKHFQSGWTLLRAGKSADAAIELGAAADASDGELASDARYFQAVALIRAGHTGEAERAIVTFLDHAPRSVRRGRAAVMLGRLIAERGDKAAARAWFEAALHDPDPSVAAAAKAAIDGAR